MEMALLADENSPAADWRADALSAADWAALPADEDADDISDKAEPIWPFAELTLVDAVWMLPFAPLMLSAAPCALAAAPLTLPLAVLMLLSAFWIYAAASSGSSPTASAQLRAALALSRLPPIPPMVSAADCAWEAAPWVLELAFARSLSALAISPSAPDRDALALERGVDTVDMAWAPSASAFPLSPIAFPADCMEPVRLPMLEEMSPSAPESWPMPLCRSDAPFFASVMPDFREVSPT